MVGASESYGVRTAWRTIQTPIPHPEAVELMRRLEQVESRSMHGQLPVVWDRAEDSSVWDPWGNRWIDFTSTIFVANAGHANPRVVEAIARTVAKPLLHAYNYPTIERIEYLEAFVSATPQYLEKAFMVSAGTEAIEVAIKLMRLNALECGKRNGVIVSFEGNWHGRTMGAQQLSSRQDQRQWIGFEDPQFLRLPFPYPWDRGVGEDPAEFFRRHFNEALTSQDLDPANDIAGFMLETYQGWGALFYPDAFVQEVMQTAASCSALVTFDEMQSGFGRTGKLFGYQHYGVEPDLVCCGKGISSSVPLALVAGSARVLDLPAVGSMSSTHSANPISCAAGLANLNALMEDRLIERSNELGELFHQRLADMASTSRLVHSVQGRGLVAAIITNSTNSHSAAEVATTISEECMRRGLLVVHTGRESVKLAPPLTIHLDALIEGLDVLADVLRQVTDDI